VRTIPCGCPVRRRSWRDYSPAIRSPASDKRDGNPLAAAYGLRLSGLRDDGLLALTGAEDFPLVTVVREITEMPDYEGHVTAEWAVVPMETGGVHVDRKAGLARMHGPRPPSDGEAIHPWLTRIAVVFCHWLGRDMFHGGAFLKDGRAWAMLGTNQAGKSTLLGRLATSGHTVLSDDALVLDGTDVLAGPRCIDLRPAAAAALGVDRTAPGRTGRPRMRLDPAPARLALAGIVHLRFAEGPVTVCRVPLASRIELLRKQAALRVTFPPGEVLLLQLAALPTFELTRPRDLGALDASATALLDALPA
jgi:hypothetical protein